MARYSKSWLNAGIYLVSIILACLVTAFFLTPNYNGGGGAVVFVVLIVALIFRLLIGFILNAYKRDKE